MELVIMVALLAIIIIGPILIGIGIPVVFGLMAYDVVEARKKDPLEAKEARRRVTVERGTARAFVIGGGVFWSLTSLAGLYSFRQTGVNDALLAALFSLFACLVTLVVGWYYERVTSVLLVLASVAVMAGGVIYQFDLGSWLLAVTALMGPMLTASVLFWLARVDQDTYERTTEIRLDLAPVFSARSLLDPVRVAA